MGLFHWIFGKHPPRPPDPERAAMVALVRTWEAPLVADELARAGIHAALNDDHTSYLTTGAIDAKVQVHVMEPDAAAARQIIQELRDQVSDALPVRAAGPDDHAFLREMLLAAVFVPDGTQPPDEAVLDTPELARYVAAFGTRPGDLGWIALDDAGEAIGAAWVRTWDPPEVGYGFVDATTPELSIAVLPAHRGRGIGSALMVALLDCVGRASLSVDHRNPAVALYARHGFQVVDRHGDSLVMLVDHEVPGGAEP